MEAPNTRPALRRAFDRFGPLPAVLLLSLWGAGCGSGSDPCVGVRCADQTVTVTVTSEVALGSVSASAPDLELSCVEVSGTRWTCSGQPIGEGPVDVTVEADGRTRMVTVDVTPRETECCGTILEGNATVAFGADAGP